MNKFREFETLLETMPSFKKQRFIHGERLFIRSQEEYEVAAVQLAFEVWTEQENRKGSSTWLL